MKDSIKQKKKQIKILNVTIRIKYIFYITNI